MTLNRRDFLIRSLLLSCGGGTFNSCNPLGVGGGSSNSKVKSFINLYMLGGPSQMDLFDYKPELYKRSGKRIDEFLTKGGQIGGVLLKPLSKFSQYGSSGAWVSDLLPYTAKMVDDLTFLKSVTSPSLVHLDAQTYSLTGSLASNTPFLGSWINYGVNAKNEMPSPFIMTDELGDPRSFPKAIQGFSIPNNLKQIKISSISKLSRELTSLLYSKEKDVQSYLSTLQKINDLGEDFGTSSGHFFNSTYLMKEKLKYLIRKNGYDEETKKLYGVNSVGENNYADQLILARHLVELEVPFVQIFCGNELDDTSWDHHFDINYLVNMCKKMDRATYGFIQDLKSRSLLDQTLVHWGGEFGRLPFIDEDGGPDDPTFGRPHNNMANTTWITGGGVKKGLTIGETDELSLRYVDRPIDHMEIWVTVMHLLGIDYKNLNYVINNKKVDFVGKRFNLISEIL